MIFSHIFCCLHSALGKDRVLVAGRMVIPDRSKIEIRSIPYKYFVYSKWNGKHYDHSTYEHIYQTNSRYIVNRCLSINQDLLTHEGTVECLIPNTALVIPTHFC